MDGTLLDPDGELTPRAIAAAASVRAAGIHLIPVTGRPPQALWGLAAKGGLGPLGVCSNGAVIVDLEAETVLEVEPIEPHVGLAMVDLVREAVPGVLMAADDLDCFSYEAGFFDFRAGWDETLEEVPDIRDVAAQGCIKLIARTSETTAPALVAMLEQVIGEVGHVTSAGLDWVDLGPPGVTKASAVKRVCERLGVPDSCVLAIGDNHNDRSLLAWAAIAMAPANAVPEVLSVAQRILPSNSDDGVAALLEELAAEHGVSR
jgi:Cof subfamily protein (haloacid dehalogenase superfamily)